MSSDSLFSQEQPTQEVPATSSVDALATKLFAIKNEQGEPKYDSLEKALGALDASQKFIPQLKDENERLKAELEALRADVSKRETVEEVIARFTTNRQPTETAHTSEAPKGLDEAAVQEMLQRTLTEREEQTVASQNVSSVRNALVAKYGEKAQEQVSAKARELGLSMDQVSQLAASAPQAVLSWFQASPSPSGAPLRSTVSLPQNNGPDKLKAPEKSLMRGGASGKDLAEFMARIKQEVYRENDITE